MAAIAATLGRRGPGQPGSAHLFPGESASRAAAFGTGMALDVTPARPELATLADQAAGDDDRYADASDDELIGVLCAWDRLVAHITARKLAAVAELIRRRPLAGCPPQDPAQMPEAWDEFADDELAQVLAESRACADDLLTVALALETRLPGTKAALRDGVVSPGKAQAIVYATHLLDPDEARAAEEMVLGRAGRLTPGGLRSAIARAVMEVERDKAKKRREQAAKDARVQRWAEDSGNAALMGRELPPAEVLAADQRITSWARQLKQAGMDGDMDVLRARAYLDLLGASRSPMSRAMPSATAAPDPDGDGPGQGRQAGTRTGPSSRSALPASTGRPADTEPGDCAPGSANQTWSSCWTGSTRRTATTGSRPRATSRGPGCGTCPGSGTPPAPARCADGPPQPVISSTTSPMRRAAGPARSAGMIHRLNSTRGGR